MTALVTNRIHKLSESLVELKLKVREDLATELATAVGTAVRDIIVVAMIDRIVNIPTRTVTSSPPSGSWRHDGCDPWVEAGDSDWPGTHARYELDERDDEELPPALPTTAALAIGVNVGRWWLARNGATHTAVGLGILATALGFAGGPFTRAALAVLAAATDLLTAESAVARHDPS